MTAGLLAKWYRLRLRCSLTADYDPAVPWDACQSFLTCWTLSSGTIAEGLIMSAIADIGLDQRVFSVTIPDLSIAWTRTEATSGIGTYDIYIEFENLRIYAVNSCALRLDADALKIYTGGTLRQTYSSISATGSILHPCAIPILGMLVPALSAKVKADTAWIASGAWGGTATAEADGGWEFKESSGDAWQTLPVSVNASASYIDYAPTCPAGAPTLPAMPTATSTYDGHVEASLTVSPGSTGSANENNAEIWLLPNVSREVVRINQDYGALWYRGGYPQELVRSTWSCNLWDDTFIPAGGTSGSSTTEVIAEASEMLSFVTNASHVIESPFSQTLYAPWTVWANKHHWNSSTGYAIQTVQAIFPFSGGRSDVIPYFKTSSPTTNAFDAVFEYIATWANPLWSLLYYFPPDGSVNESWKVDGTDPTRLYWLAIREQFIHNTALPSGEDIHQRTSIVESPLLDGGYSDWIKENLFDNAETHWVGIPRFNIVTPSVPSSITLTSGSSGAWSAVDGTLTFGTDITVTPDSGKTVVTVTHDIGRFTEIPWQVLHICDRIKPNWADTNVSQIKVYAESADGTSRVLLENISGDGYTTKNITYDIPIGTDTKYAGSYGQDDGVGLVTDTGTDLLPAGQSSTVCADSERVHSFNLLAGQTFSKIVYIITLTGVVTLNYPIFYPSASDVTLLYENSHHSILLWPDGPGIRVGQWSWRNGTAIRTTPLVEPLGSPYVSGYRMTALDALCTKRVLFEGKAADDGLATEISTLYDSVEGVSYTNVDQFTNAFCLPKGSSVGKQVGLLCLVNSFSAIPPLCSFVRKKRNTDWAETGNYGQWSYSLCVLPRYIVSNTKIDMFDNSSVKWTSDSLLTLSGWAITEYSHSIDNTETNFKLKSDSTEIATVRPWRGWFINYSFIPLSSQGIANCHSNMAAFWQAHLSEGNIFVKRANYGNPRGGWDNSVQVTSSGGCSDVAVDFCSALLTVVYTRDSNVCMRVSNDKGVSFRSEQIIMANGILNRIKSSPLGDSIIATFKYDSGTSGPGKIYISKRLRGSTSWSTATPLLNSSGTALAVADDGFDFSYGHANGRWVLSATKSGATDSSVFVSFDKMTSVREC